MVVIYSRKTCAPCRTIKYWLDQKKIEYKVIDMDEVSTEYALAPTVVIGEHVLPGGTISQIAHVLGL